MRLRAQKTQTNFQKANYLTNLRPGLSGFLDCQLQNKVWQITVTDQIYPAVCLYSLQAKKEIVERGKEGTGLIPSLYKMQRTWRFYVVCDTEESGA